MKRSQQRKLQEAKRQRVGGPRVRSLTYWTVYTPCVLMAPGAPHSRLYGLATRANTRVYQPISFVRDTGRDSSFQLTVEFAKRRLYPVNGGCVSGQASSIEDGAYRDRGLTGPR
ncbi:hypothetical protein WH47_06786 [Habropoda laboriosa]|uniref:Uncharacterized protein n=1 Tax=Habropoda laboriosa TaxID=597456 RepID=A0A0L7RJ23_9HYME|nr:hypothetical protein WH47_06786 [Habropoda laboriosa]